MVRFIINYQYRVIFILKNIYIPIWLDLLYYLKMLFFVYFLYLHSNMVRFIIKKKVEIA